MNKKNIKNAKVVSLSAWRLTSKPEPVYAHKPHAYKKTCTSNSFVVLPRLYATYDDYAHKLLNGESGMKEKAGKILQS